PLPPPPPGPGALGPAPPTQPTTNRPVCRIGNSARFDSFFMAPCFAYARVRRFGRAVSTRCANVGQAPSRWLGAVILEASTPDARLCHRRLLAARLSIVATLAADFSVALTSISVVGGRGSRPPPRNRAPSPCGVTLARWRGMPPSLSSLARFWPSIARDIRARILQPARVVAAAGLLIVACQPAPGGPGGAGAGGKTDGVGPDDEGVGAIRRICLQNGIAGIGGGSIVRLQHDDGQGSLTIETLIRVRATIPAQSDAGRSTLCEVPAGPMRVCPEDA